MKAAVSLSQNGMYAGIIEKRNRYGKAILITYKAVRHFIERSEKDVCDKN